MNSLPAYEHHQVKAFLDTNIFCFLKQSDENPDVKFDQVLAALGTACRKSDIQLRFRVSRHKRTKKLVVHCPDIKDQLAWEMLQTFNLLREKANGRD